MAECTITRPEPQALFNRYRDMFSSTVLNGAPIIPESNEWYVVALEYAAAQEFYSLAEQQWKERDPRYACCDNLLALAAVDGVLPRAATFSSTYATITGTPGVPLPRQIQIVDGTKTYVSATSVPSKMPSDGSLTLRFQALTPGPDTNTATTGSLQGAIAGVDSTVTLGGSYCGGQDAESCEEFRSRYLKRKSFQPVPNAAWIEEKLLEWPCVTRVCQRKGTCCVADSQCSTCNTCQRTLDYYVFMDGTFTCGIVPTCVLQEIDKWLFGENKGYGEGQVPVGICGTLYSPSPVTIDVDIVGSGCFTSAQRGEVEERIAEYFTTLCPSEFVLARQIELIITQVVGAGVNFDVTLTPSGDNAAQARRVSDLCSDLEMACDFMPCLGTVEFEELLSSDNCVR